MTALDDAMDDAKHYLAAADDPRNWSAEQVTLRLLVAYIEASGVRD